MPFHFCEGCYAVFYYCEKDLNLQDSDVIAWFFFLLISWSEMPIKSTVANEQSDRVKPSKVTVNCQEVPITSV